jgi:hypothetical protein
MYLYLNSNVSVIRSLEAVDVECWVHKPCMVKDL